MAKEADKIKIGVRCSEIASGIHAANTAAEIGLVRAYAEMLARDLRKLELDAVQAERGE